MLSAQLASTTRDLKQILRLQHENLPANIDNAEMQSQGFVTLRHDLPVLEKMHQLAPGVIIKDNDTVIAYALTMLRECRELIPDLEPMFSVLDELGWQDRPLNDYRFYIMGQICIARNYRGLGLFEQLYQHHKEVYRHRFDLLVTEISARNHRSLRAHEKTGFKTIHTHRDKLDEWKVVAWDWS
ncbi:MAG: GNAT family N-acetyltransferase [Bacteroidota bacterium]|nr:GNAT family N-acetyltransferase [Bacteroidota bacterium]